MKRKTKAGNTPAREDAKPVKLTLRLPVQLAKRFGIHATKMGLSKSGLFAELVKNGCRQFVVHDLRKPGRHGDALDAA